jgi:hypothetical protein
MHRTSVIIIHTASSVSWLFVHIKVSMYLLLLLLLLLLSAASFSTTHRSLKAHCAILVRRSNFRHQASPRVSPREGTQRRKVELWARNVRKFCLNADSHVTFRDLLHAVKLRHGTDSFTSPPKEGVLRIFLPQKSDGFGRVWTRKFRYRRPARYL